ncbi:hypothetical protein [Actinomadura verrucosospora]|uniref:Uncharacterized protein n=1 Tax=Actinomadura verrucosospora TaxID=46165 RepID=A0A7D3ZI78_ACTVE|nr:hypothetical protein [Actinomadura verrucosospora]QKG24577.1 hypothetical protein ACTIVE_6224 [Actinomadura verrucosospora]
MQKPNTPDMLDFDALVRELEEVKYFLTDTEQDYDAEFAAELRRRTVDLVVQLAGPLAEIVDEVGGLVRAVRSDDGDIKLTELDDRNLWCLLWLFDGLWKNTTTWGNAEQDDPFPQGAARRINTLVALTNLADRLS